MKEDDGEYDVGVDEGDRGKGFERVGCFCRCWFGVI